MKKIVLLAIFANMFLLISCGSTAVYQLKTTCTASNDEIFKNLTFNLLQENFMIKNCDTSLGYLLAETAPSKSYLSPLETRSWLIQIKNNKIYAYAKIKTTRENEFGAISSTSEEYLNDDASDDLTWYWHIRNSIAKVCQNKIVIIEKEGN